MTLTERTHPSRLALPADRLTVLAGAHDALSAHLIEEAGFDGVWASSFGISLASKCVPDTDVMTMTENLEVVRQMVGAVSVPVVADVSAGYGDALNVRRLVDEFAATGVAGVCLEDNPFPKRCSLYDGVERRLVDVSTMVGKIEAARSVALASELTIIARTEALIADLGADEAIRRAHAYADAGADALLVHAKRFDAWTEFAERWDRAIPLVSIPTLFPEVRFDQLAAYDVRLAIYPNQAVRASIKSMQTTLTAILEARCGEAAEPEIVPLAEVYRIVDLDAMMQAEDKYIHRRQAQTNGRGAGDG